ncbi:hypothetical protein KUTeg_015278 [Tegillarca granosa]|uniref:Uncharacterized protein n=1 Tax=Tegillarca granosa TaxID=220873 RepID=A0ABQ9EPP7_TEGGR|nr:hypothetical protein KUTeg_015278 [Tegillarca granosa]
MEPDFIAIFERIKDQYNLPDLKEEQKNVVQKLIAGKDVFCVLPTGFGKSMCYTVTPLMLDQVIMRFLEAPHRCKKTGACRSDGLLHDWRLEIDRQIFGLYGHCQILRIFKQAPVLFHQQNMGYPTDKHYYPRFRKQRRKKIIKRCKLFLVNISSYSIGGYMNMMDTQVTMGIINREMMHNLDQRDEMHLYDTRSQAHSVTIHYGSHIGCVGRDTFLVGTAGQNIYHYQPDDINLPDFEEEKRHQNMGKMTPDEIRIQFKKYGLKPFRKDQDKPITMTCSGDVWDQYVPPEGDGKSSLLSGILAIYDRFGRLMFGNENVAKDVLEYVVFEKHVVDYYGKWKVHAKIIPSWLPPPEPVLRTYRKPKLPEISEESHKPKENLYQEYVEDDEDLHKGETKERSTMNK